MPNIRAYRQPASIHRTAKRVRRRWELLLLGVALTAGAAHANVYVNAANPLWETSGLIGGSNIYAHQYKNFHDNKINGTTVLLQEDASAAKVPVFRMQGYPDDRTTNTLSFFDTNKVNPILNHNGGGQSVPLFVDYIAPPLNYYSTTGSLTGNGRTCATNLVWLTKHYLGHDGSGYALNLQNHEIANEPDLKIDYLVSNWIEYAQVFRSCHEALVAAGLRSHVNLAAQAIYNNYKHVSPFGDKLAEYTLATVPDGVNTINYHKYCGVALNNPLGLDNIADVNRTVYFGQTTQDSHADFGEGALTARLAQYNLSQAWTGTALTEFDIVGSSYYHTMYQGVWDLAMNQFALKNPIQKLTSTFCFDWSGDHGHYDASFLKNFAYWNLYIRGNLTGRTLLEENTTGNFNPSGNPYLLAAATRDANYVYIEIINRNDVNAITDTVTLNGVLVNGSATRYEMSNNGSRVTPDTGTNFTFTSGSSYTFPKLSATIFKIPYTPASGFGLTLDKSHRMVNPGGSSTRYTLSVTRQGSFSADPALNISNLPSGVTATFTRIGTSDSYYIDLAAGASVTPGSYYLNVYGSGGGLTANTPVWLVVAPQDFAVCLAPNAYSSTVPTLPPTIQVAAGNTTTLRVSIIPTGSFAGTTTLSVSGLPAYTTITGPMTVNGAGFTLLNIQAGASAPVGSYTLTFTGTAPDITGARTGAATLQINSAAAAPSAPTGLATTIADWNLVTLNWTHNAGASATGYSVERSTDGTNYTELIGFNLMGCPSTPPSPYTLSSYTDVQARPGITYYYRVRCLNAAGASAYSNVASVRTRKGHQIVFENETGDAYTTTGGNGGGGNLVGQRTWTGAYNLLNVRSGIGHTGAQAVLSAASSISPAIPAYSANSYTPTSADFNGDSAPVTSGYTGQVQYSFDVALSTPTNNGSSAQAWFFRMGRGAAEFFLMSNGTLKIRCASGDILATTATGGTTAFDFDTFGTGKYVNIRGTINYATATDPYTFTCFVDGVQQKTSPTGTTAFPFVSLSYPWFSIVHFQTNSDTSSAGYIRAMFDNVRFNEPN